MWWTAQRSRPISAAMANRLFLTLLALLTGLAAQIGPAQARVRADETAVVALVAPPAARPAAAPAELARLPEPGWRHARMVAGAEPAPLAVAPAPAAVLIGIDRSRR